ncbi:hypothetical protein HMPREF3145_11005 [Corynebacterium sp. HMSC05C01]|uniref:hypothetical protein n=1 Tax=Corynebacterium sp. HMSC05C01 TaxID=1581113 RepID=UPI0008A231D7|nr:hypothetical protein [Corynebacterium sp. HMSC05C01]OFT67630.1 hypothetical protein HMPREF3145_11005 [Corynebacterium sp. HMSC05C01]
MHILDTGPIFKFLATDSVPQLIAALGNHAIHVPEAVEYEIKDTPTRRPQFARAAELWPRLPDRFKVSLSDTPTDELRQLCQSILHIGFDEMYKQTRDRGENMAILHAVALARKGEHVIVVCDEEVGTAKIRRESNALKMQQTFGHHIPGGRIQHADTITLLRWAIEANAFDSHEAFLKKYQAMTSLDEALPKDVKTTGLTGRPPWPLLN